MSLDSEVVQCSIDYFDIIKKFMLSNNNAKVLQSIISNIEDTQIYIDNASSEQKDSVKCITLSLKVFLKLSDKTFERLVEIDGYVED